MNKIALLFCMLLFVPVCAQGAGLVSRGTALDASATYNPQPDARDIILPMPCDLSMVFKAVAVPAQGLLWDMDIAMGLETSSRASMEYYDRKFSEKISAPFTRKDVPADWQARLDPDSKLPRFYYFIGKYEVSQQQWDALMSGQCPAQPVTEDAARPRTNISWHEAQDFARAYSLWLIEHAPKALPHFADDQKNVGFIRLPTEAEWEYAARGAQAVPAETLRQEAFFPLAQGAGVGDYAVYRAESAARIVEKPQVIGSRKPNPLGLYDTAGNVAELVQDNFRFSLGGRLHGATGGAMRKGGSFLSSEAEVMPGSREEVALFNDRGLVSAKDLGLRVALSGINTPGGDRSAQLMKEWSHMGEAALFDTSANPIEEIDKLLAATHEPTAKENLARLRSVIKDNNIELERQRNISAEGVVRTMLFLADAMRNLGVRHYMTLNTLDDIQKTKAGYLAKGDKQSARNVEKNLQEFEELKLSLRDGLGAAGNFYKSKLQEARAFPADMLNRNLDRVAQDFTSKALFDENMRQNLDRIKKHMTLLANNKPLPKEQIIKDILPKHLQKGL